MPSIQIQPVRSRRNLRAFVKLPWAVYDGDSNWVPPLIVECLEVLDDCRAALEPYRIPARVRFVADFPPTSTGKPQKFKLRTLALQEAQDGESP